MALKRDGEGKGKRGLEDGKAIEVFEGEKENITRQKRGKGA